VTVSVTHLIVCLNEFRINANDTIALLNGSPIVLFLHVVIGQHLMYALVLGIQLHQFGEITQLLLNSAVHTRLDSQDPEPLSFGYIVNQRLGLLEVLVESRSHGLREGTKYVDHGEFRVFLSSAAKMR